MKNIYFLLISFTLALVVAACGKTDTTSSTDTRSSLVSSGEINATAPDFTLKDLSGRNSSLSDYRGKVVLIEFWATWCPPCKASVPSLVGLQKKYGQKDFIVLGLSIDTDSDASEKVRQFSAAYNINYPVLLANETIQKNYNVISIPTSFLLGKDGKIIDIYRGYSDEFDTKVSAQIEKLL